MKTQKKMMYVVSMFVVLVVIGVGGSAFAQEMDSLDQMKKKMTTEMTTEMATKKTTEMGTKMATEMTEEMPAEMDEEMKADMPSMTTSPQVKKAIQAVKEKAATQKPKDHPAH